MHKHMDLDIIGIYATRELSYPMWEKKGKSSSSKVPLVARRDMFGCNNATSMTRNPNNPETLWVQIHISIKNQTGPYQRTPR